MPPVIFFGKDNKKPGETQGKTLWAKSAVRLRRVGWAKGGA